jgi:hypothetical protein
MEHLKKEKMIKNIFIVFSMIIFSFCCKQNNKHLVDESKHGYINHFVGDFTLSKRNYFKTLTTGNTAQLLEKQNSLYLKNFFQYQSEKISSLNAVNIKLIKENSSNKKDIKINLYTYLGNKKIDSIQFYRNISGDGFGYFNSLSYVDTKTKKIWQIRYFPINPLRGNTVGIVSYTEKSITDEGNIKTDSIHYLDESLDVEMVNYHLYY